jgi:pilus assembly protein CpaB
MRNKVVGFTLAGLLALLGLGLLLTSGGGDDKDTKVDTAAGTDGTAKATPSKLADADAKPVELVGVAVPPELARVTLQLEAQRALGGLVNPGDLVAVNASFDRAASSTAPDTGPQTGIILEKVLVASVQVDTPAGKAKDPTPPKGTLLITLAVAPADAPRLVYAAEYGKVWLAGETATTPESGRTPTNLATITPVPAP